MATSKFETFLQDRVWRTEWSSLADDEAGDAASLSKWPTKSVQVSGTFGASGSISIEGSNDGTEWTVLTDGLGEDLTFTTAGLKEIYQNTQFVRPHVTVGDGDTDLKVVIVAT